MPFIKSIEPQHNLEEEFDEKRGVDIFIDQIRFIPTNCTIVKVLVRMVNKKFVDLVKASACIPDFESLVPLPTYNFKWELRSDINYDKTAFLFLIFITIDVNTQDGKPNIMGYSFFPLFLDKNTKEPATEASEDILLHDGQYQLPIFCQDYPYALDFDMKTALELEKLPCCTVLLRIRKPPVDADGQPLGLESVEKSLWPKEVWPPFKSYRENFYYCNKYIENSKAEDVIVDSFLGTLCNPVQRSCQSSKGSGNHQTPVESLQRTNHDTSKLRYKRHKRRAGNICGQSS